MKDYITEKEEVDVMVCMVIDHVVKNMGLDTRTIGTVDDGQKRADMYRKVGNELLALARHLDYEQEYRNSV